MKVFLLILFSTFLFAGNIPDTNKIKEVPSEGSSIFVTFEKDNALENFYPFLIDQFKSDIKRYGFKLVNKEQEASHVVVLSTKSFERNRTERDFFKNEIKTSISVYSFKNKESKEYNMQVITLSSNNLDKEIYGRLLINQVSQEFFKDRYLGKK